MFGYAQPSATINCTKHQTMCVEDDDHSPRHIPAVKPMFEIWASHYESLSKSFINKVIRDKIVLLLYDINNETWLKAGFLYEISMHPDCGGRVCKLGWSQNPKTRIKMHFKRCKVAVSSTVRIRPVRYAKLVDKVLQQILFPLQQRKLDCLYDHCLEEHTEYFKIIDCNLVGFLIKIITEWIKRHVNAKHLSKSSTTTVISPAAVRELSLWNEHVDAFVLQMPSWVLQDSQRSFTDSQASTGSACVRSESSSPVASRAEGSCIVLGKRLRERENCDEEGSVSSKLSRSGGKEDPPTASANPPINSRRRKESGGGGGLLIIEQEQSVRSPEVLTVTTPEQVSPLQTFTPIEFETEFWAIESAHAVAAAAVEAAQGSSTSSSSQYTDQPDFFTKVEEFSSDCIHRGDLNL